MKLRKARKWIDVTVTIKPGMVHWPSDPAFATKRYKDMEKGDRCNVSLMHMGTHTGTHMDPPLHFIRGGKSLDQMPIDATVGAARVIEIKDNVSIKPQELIGHKIRRGERILFKTRNSSRVWKTDRFIKDFVYIY